MQQNRSQNIDDKFYDNIIYTFVESCYGEICYQVLALDKAHNWPGATLECEAKGLEGGTFFDRGVMSRMEGVVRSLGVSAWIGLKLETVFTWRWYDGEYYCSDCWNNICILSPH